MSVSEPTYSFCSSVLALARIFNAQIYGGRIIRLPDRRFRYEIVGPIEPHCSGCPRIKPSKMPAIICMVSSTSILPGPRDAVNPCSI